jgi:flavin-dependent dehydrogenase
MAWVSLIGCATTEVRTSNLNSEQLQLALSSHRGEFRTCYEKEIKGRANPPTGKVTVKFTVDSDGVARTVAIRKTALNLPNTENCVVAVIKNIQFPHPLDGGTADVIYPLEFEAK